MTIPLVNAASAYCFEILCDGNFQRVIRDLFGVSAFAALVLAAVLSLFDVEDPSPKFLRGQ